MEILGCQFVARNVAQSHGESGAAKLRPLGGLTPVAAHGSAGSGAESRVDESAPFDQPGRRSKQIGEYTPGMAQNEFPLISLNNINDLYRYLKIISTTPSVPSRLVVWTLPTLAAERDSSPRRVRACMHHGVSGPRRSRRSSCVRRRPRPIRRGGGSMQSILLRRAP